MAGIIARITRSNRERLDRKKNEIGTSKSNVLNHVPFDDHFVPEVSVTFFFLYRVCLFLAHVLTETYRRGFVSLL